MSTVMDEDIKRWTAQRGSALALVIDFCSRELLGWHLSRSGKAKTAESAVEQALITRFGTLGRVPQTFSWWNIGLLVERNRGSALLLLSK